MPIHQSGPGDTLAAGGASATFSQRPKNITDTHWDFIVMEQADFQTKYALDADNYQEIKNDINNGTKIPNLLPLGVPTPVEDFPFEAPLSVVDKRPTYDDKPKQVFRGTPLGEYVLLRRMTEKEVSEGGIHIPEVAKRKSDQAIVVAVGPGYLNPHPTASALGLANQYIPLSIRPGMLVLFNKWAGVGTEIELEGGEHVVVREAEILLILEEVKQ